MGLSEALGRNDFILTEAAVIESLRRSGSVRLHPRLENALLIYDEVGRRALFGLYGDFASIAFDAGVPLTLCTPTWRANRERLAEAGIETDVNGDAVAFLRDLRSGRASPEGSLFIGGLIGCRNDCYRPGEGLSTEKALAFHAWQVDRLTEGGADFLLAATLPSLPEAAGIALAMERTGLPYVLSFVIDRGGLILDGTRLNDAFERIDRACVRPPLGYMVNCAYPSFLNPETQPGSLWSRLIGCQANASSLDHARLDGADRLLSDDLRDWGDRMIELNRRFGVKILGGCCGTGPDHLKYLVTHLRREADAGPGS
jgi:homocysteine S-methyltransferase